MSDFNFMKSGSGDDINLTDKQILELQALVLKFMENALHKASTYVQHANRNIVQLLDIQNCMKVEAMIYCKNQNSLQEANQLLDDLLNLDYQDEDDDLSDIITNDEEEFTISQHNCPLCLIVKNIDSYWNSWKPETPLEFALKKNIDKFS